MKTPAPILAALLIPSLLLPACGGGGGGGGGGGATATPTTPATPSGRTITGLAQKGPFREGAILTATPLDANGAKMGDPIRARILSHRGDYRLTIPEGWVPASGSVLLEVSGDYYDEWLRDLSSGTLRSIVPANAASSTWNINLLTHLAVDDVLDNLRNGMPASAALSDAEDALLASFSSLASPKTTNLAFHELDLLDDDENNLDSTSLLFISVIFSAYASDLTTAMSKTQALAMLETDVMPLELFFASFNCDLDGVILVDAILSLGIDAALSDDEMRAGILRNNPHLDDSAPFNYALRGQLLEALRRDEEVMAEAESLRQACASTARIVPGGSARYILTFRGQWSPDTHTGAHPGSSAHFTPLIGATHNGDVRLWKEGRLAIPAMEQFAETGETGQMSAVIMGHISDGNAYEEVRADHGGSPGGMSTAFASFIATPAHPFLSVALRVAPSPDWFVGLDSFPLRNSEGRWIDYAMELHAYDAGTEDGDGFSSSNDDTQPKEVIAPLDTGPLAASTDPPPLAAIRFSPLPNVRFPGPPIANILSRSHAVILPPMPPGKPNPPER